MESTKSLLPEGHIEEGMDEYTEKFAEHLQGFINGRTDEDTEQREMLKIAGEQFKGAPLHLIKEGCSKCYGRGFTGYNVTYKYYTPCFSCLNIKK